MKGATPGSLGFRWGGGGGGGGSDEGVASLFVPSSCSRDGPLDRAWTEFKPIQWACGLPDNLNLIPRGHSYLGVENNHFPTMFAD